MYLTETSMTETACVEHSPRLRPVVRRNNDWTLKEHEIVVSHWPDIATIQKLLPHRSKHAIRSFASKCNLRKPIHQWTPEQTAVLKRRVREFVPIKSIAHELGLTPLKVTNRLRYLGITYSRRPPTATGNKLMDGILRRAFDLNMSRSELDEACGSGGQFQRWSPERKIALKHIRKAVEVMEGELTVEWSDL